MAIVNITTEEDKYLILTSGENIRYLHSGLNMQTSYCDACWTVETFNNEADWLARLAELEIEVE